MKKLKSFLATLGVLLLIWGGVIFASCSTNDDDKIESTPIEDPNDGKQPSDETGEVNKPVIVSISENTTVLKGTKLSLLVSAKSSDGGELSYQWYSASTADSEGTKIDGATAAVYSFTSSDTTKYYYVVVTNTKDGKSAAAKSSVISVVITEKEEEVKKPVVKPLSIEGAVSGVMEGGESGTRAQLTMLTGETDFENALQEYAFTYSSDKMTGWGASEGTIIFKIMATSTPGIWSDDWGAPKDETITLTVQEELSASELEGKDPVDVYDFTKLYQRGTAEAPYNPGNIVVDELFDGESYKILVRYYPLTNETAIAIVGTVIDFPSLVQTDDGKSYKMTRSGSTYQYVFDKETAAGTRKFLIASRRTPSIYWSTESVVNESGEVAEAKSSQPGYMTFSYEAGKPYFVSVDYDMDTEKAIISAGEYDGSILGKADIIGGFDGWKGSKLTRVNDTTYTFDFTNDATEIEFDIREKAGTWDVGRWFKGIPADTFDHQKTDICDDIIATKKGASLTAVTPIYYKGDSGMDGQNLKIMGLPYKTGYKFRLTATIVDADSKKLSLTVQALDDIPEADFVKPDSLYKADGIAWICSNYGNYEIAWGEKKADGSYEGTVTIPAGASETWSKANVIEFGVTNDTNWSVKYTAGDLTTADTPVKLTKGSNVNNTITGVNPSETDVVITVISTEDSISVKYSL